jgi:hypothetical protein
MVSNDDLKAEVNKCRDDVNGVRYRLNNVEKMQKDMSEKIDKLLETDIKIDHLIQQGERLSSLSENDKSETKRRLDEHGQKIEQSMERVEALFEEPLTYQRTPLSPKIPEINSESQGNQEILEEVFQEICTSLDSKTKITKNLKRSYQSMTERTIEELLFG